MLGGEEILALNLWEYPQMAALFALGVLAQEREWLSDGLSPQLRRACGRAAAVGLVLAVLVGVGISITDDPEKFLGGLHFEATLILLIEATLTLAMSLWVIEWFRRRGNRAGSLVPALGRASFAAYLVHVPITVLLAIILREVGVPAELKLLSVYALGVVASFGLGWVSTRSRVAGRIV